MSKTMLCKIHKGILSLEKKRKMARFLMAWERINQSRKKDASMGSKNNTDIINHPIGRNNDTEYAERTQETLPVGE